MQGTRSHRVAGPAHTSWAAPFHCAGIRKTRWNRKALKPAARRRQLDPTFWVQIDVLYPDRDTERDILIATHRGCRRHCALRSSAARPELIAAQGLLRRMTRVGERVVDSILDLVRACRPGEAEAHDAVQGNGCPGGPGPRVGTSPDADSARNGRLLQGRLAPSLDDVAAMAPPGAVAPHGAGFCRTRARGPIWATIIDTVAAQATDMAAAA